MKYLAITFIVAICGFLAYSQNSEDLLAKANGLTITANDLPDQLKSEHQDSEKLISAKRVSLLSDQISSLLLEIEAKSKNISVEKLFENFIYADVKNPSDEELRTIYEINRAQIGNKSFEEMRPQIIGFLRRDSEQKAYEEYTQRLKIKYKVVYGKNIADKNLVNRDVLASIGLKQITFKDFSDRSGAKLADFEGHLYDHLKIELEEVIFNKILLIEAESLGVRPSELIAAEITNKLRDFSDEEREHLEGSFRRKLFSKYNVKTFLKEPAPFVQNISADGDPALGNSSAAVTVVMFSDFQCPACASVHPILKKVISGYGNDVRFVVRDFPLVNIHSKAFRAAAAANAANLQGKYFEYAELLYRNQNNLDDNSLRKYAADLGLNMERFELDLENETIANEIRSDMADGNSYGVSGTPTIFVNGVKIRILSAQNFKEAIDKAIKK